MQLDRRELQVLRDLRVIKGSLEQRVLKVLLALRGHKVLLEHKEL